MNPAYRFVAVVLCSGWLLLIWGIAALTSPWAWTIGLGIGFLIAGAAFMYAAVQEERRNGRRATIQSPEPH